MGKTNSNIGHCAAASNLELSVDTGYQITGNAWTRQRGMDYVYSGYNDIMSQRPSQYDRQQVSNWNHQAADQFKDWYSQHPDSIRPGDVVSMYYNGSPAQEMAYNEGYNGETNTHTGHIIQKNGKLYVRHEIHGKWFEEPIEVNLGGNQRNYGITGIYRPAKTKVGDFLNKVGHKVKSWFTPYHQSGGVMNYLLYVDYVE